MSALPNKGMIVSVYRTARLGDCTNGGVTSRTDECTLVGPGIDQIFEVKPERPALVLVKRNIFGSEYIHAVPADLYEAGVHTMAGGNFVYTCDSRIREICAYPIPVHDRVEGPGQYMGD